MAEMTNPQVALLAAATLIAGRAQDDASRDPYWALNVTQNADTMLRWLNETDAKHERGNAGRES